MGLIWVQVFGIATEVGWFFASVHVINLSR